MTLRDELMERDVLMDYWLDYYDKAFNAAASQQ